MESTMNDVESRKPQESASREKASPPEMRKKRTYLIGGTVLLVAVVGIALLVALLVADSDDASATPYELRENEYAELIEGFNLSSDTDTETLQYAMSKPLIVHMERSDQCGAGGIIGITRPDPTDSTKTERIIEAHGTPKVGLIRVIDGDTLFELGSISKPMTGLVLANEILNNEDSPIFLSTPVNDLLPLFIPRLLVHYTDGSPSEEVTLRHLVTHTSGLPRVHDLGKSIFDWETESPYEGFSEADFLDVIGRLATQENGLTLSTPGQVQYSNLGFALLGYVLGKNHGSSFPELQRELTTSLNMTSTFLQDIPIDQEDDIMRRMATGHRPNGNPAYYWYDNGLMINGAGSTVSSTNDVLTWLETLMAVSEEREVLPESIRQALSLSIAPQYDLVEDATQGIALGWFFSHPKSTTAPELEDTFYWHNGGTAGFSTFASFQPSTQIGIVALSNCGDSLDMNAIGNVFLKKLFR